MFAFATKCGQTRIAPTVEYVTRISNTNVLTTYTFSGASLGSEGQSRKIIVVVFARSNSSSRSVSSVTVAGNSASSIIANNSDISGDATEASIWAADAPTGTTGDIVVTMSAQFAQCTIAIYAARNLLTLTADDTSSDSGSDSTINLNLDATDSGFAVAGVYYSDNRSTTWSGLTENSDANIVSRAASSASDNFTTGGTKTITATAPISSVHKGVAAYFK